MSGTIHKHGSTLSTAQAACSRAGGALQSEETQLQDVCPPESSLREEVSRLHSNQTPLEEQRGLQARCGGPI